MRVEMASLELHKFAGVFDIDGAPIGVSAVGHDDGAAAPIRFFPGGQERRLMKPVDEDYGTLA
jgi:hypothetical protein